MPRQTTQEHMPDRQVIQFLRSSAISGGVSPRPRSGSNSVQHISAAVAEVLELVDVTALALHYFVADVAVDEATADTGPHGEGRATTHH